MVLSVPSSAGGGPGSADEFADGRLLDGFLLLAAGGSSSPDDIVSVNLSSLQVVDVADEDLTFFAHLDRLDVSDNRLSHEHVLQQLARFPRLGSLSLACNSISHLQVPSSESFRHLHALDLSFNGLHGDVLAQLARLPSLVTLNLSSNCISSVPPEGDLYGLQTLEELLLNDNDLVQFVQWRALDALPRLRKLSLASNRVKRLKDDAPDNAGFDICYFRELEELDLSCNEIASVDHLPVMRLFRMLKKLHLSDNPCMNGTKGPQKNQSLPGVELFAAKSKPFFLKGNGSFVRREKPTQPKLKMSLKKLRKVRSEKFIDPSAKKKNDITQLGVYDEETNQLLIELRSGAPSVDISTHEALDDGQAYDSGDEVDGTFLTGADPNLAGHGASRDSEGVLNDELSEEEIDLIFQERRKMIDRAFATEVEVPGSFMRPPPFGVTASFVAAKDRLFKPPEQPTPSGRGSSDAAAADQARAALSAAGLGGARRTSEASDGVDGRSSVASGRRRRRSPPQASPHPHEIVQGTWEAALAQAAAPVEPRLYLPPISRSRCSSAASSARPPSGKKPPVPDVGVRDAIRALRAAAMSEYAVAA